MAAILQIQNDFWHSFTNLHLQRQIVSMIEYERDIMENE